MNRKHSGVTLVELLIVVVILGVLASIALPSYRNYVIRSNRTDGKVALMSVAGLLERCYTRFNAYDDVGCTVTLPVTSNEGHYRVESISIVGNAFSLQAVPLGAQAADTGCGNLRLDSRGRKTVSGSKSEGECWAR